ncbi:hypothetical protein KDJ56_10370 [Brevibacillus composti]|uniref:DUF4350 domain-containing protein n=1 Tax=Brevibacillus composti TaxID=2796470 RepID=A0A7T5EPD1_9BACL|nr:hypothetical protein [Brevibacillus composti]QQE76283.1 hypothetical protein JD108_10680 [Brevibacillus composti]QUO43311.1 hypothetical protein KDJ56_10370 [Brevibacillus composti]
MRWKWLLALAVLCAGAMPSAAAAEGTYDIQIDQPMDGIIKYDSWMRLDVKVTSRGQPFSGYVELGTDRNQMQPRKASLKQPLTLEEGETKQVSFELPVEMMMNDLRLRLLEGERTVKSEKIRLSYPRDGILVGVLHESDNAYHFLSMNQSHARYRAPYLVQHVKQESLPTEPWLYRNLNMLALGGKDVTALTDDQLAAIKLWVKTGGIVILSAGPGQESAVSRFAELLPPNLRLGGQVQAEKGLRPYLTDKITPQWSIPVYSDQLPLFFAQKSGEGYFLFVNYDVTQEPMASWQYNGQLWQSVFQRHGILEKVNNTIYFDQLGRPLLELSRQIPGVQTPNPWVMAGIWGGYVLLVAPALYLVLRRKDKRPWAWGMIPAAAVLLGTGVFVLGKPLVVAENVSYAVTRIHLLDKDTAQAMTASTVLAVSGGELLLETKPGAIALPLMVGRNDYELDGTRLTAKEDDGSILAFQEVPYLTPRQVSAFGLVQHAGKMDVDLHVEGDRMRGVIQNNSSYSFDQTYVQIGLQRIPIGSLQKGEKKSVEVKLESLYTPRQPYIEGEETPEQRLMRLQDAVLTYGSADTVRVIGINRDPLSLVTAKLPHRSHYYNVISQNIELKPDRSGKITFPYGMLRVNILETKGDLDVNPSGLWEISKGSVTFSLELGQAINVAERIVVPLDHSMYRPFVKEVFHQKSGKWKTLDREKRLVLGEELREYLTPEGAIQIRLSHPGEERLAFSMPYFQVEGKERGLDD